jgi:hypothetical protein
MKKSYFKLAILNCVKTVFLMIIYKSLGKKLKFI